jgi:hypothetical protein
MVYSFGQYDYVNLRGEINSLIKDIYSLKKKFPALPDFLSSSGSGTGSTQPREPREVNEELLE